MAQERKVSFTRPTNYSNFMEMIVVDKRFITSGLDRPVAGPGDIKCLERNSESRRRETLRGYRGMLARKSSKISVLSNDFSCILSLLLYHFG